MSKAKIGARMQVLKILWGALTISIGMFGVVLFVVRQNQAAQGVDNAMLAGLGVAAVVEAVLSLTMPASMYRQALKNKTFDLKEEAFGDAAAGQNRDAVETHRVFAKPEKALALGILMYQTPFILGMALGEAVAINGLVLGFLGQPITVVVPFFVVSLGLALSRFPSTGGIIKQMQLAVGARMPQ
jgi:hypothetical protein